MLQPSYGQNLETIIRKSEILQGPRFKNFYAFHNIDMNSEAGLAFYDILNEIFIISELPDESDWIIENHLEEISLKLKYGRLLHNEIREFKWMCRVALLLKQIQLENPHKYNLIVDVINQMEYKGSYVERLQDLISLKNSYWYSERIERAKRFANQYIEIEKAKRATRLYLHILEEKIDMADIDVEAIRFARQWASKARPY